MENHAKTQQEIEKEMQELNEQFSEFLHTKGIAAKFRLAFCDMKESAQKQHETDAANFAAVKAKSAEDNKEFVEFLHTKGIKAKCRLVMENIKNGAKEAPARTAGHIAEVQAKTQANIAQTGSHAKTGSALQECTAESLAEQFNAFLKTKGLDSQYTVVITEEKA